MSCFNIFNKAANERPRRNRKLLRPDHPPRKQNRERTSGSDTPQAPGRALALGAGLEIDSGNKAFFTNQRPKRQSRCDTSFRKPPWVRSGAESTVCACSAQAVRVRACSVWTLCVCACSVPLSWRLVVFLASLCPCGPRFLPRCGSSLSDSSFGFSPTSASLEFGYLDSDRLVVLTFFLPPPLLLPHWEPGLGDPQRSQALCTLEIECISACALVYYCARWFARGSVHQIGACVLACLFM